MKSNIKLNYRIGFLLTVCFIIGVSYLILEPEINKRKQKVGAIDLVQIENERVKINGEKFLSYKDRVLANKTLREIVARYLKKYDIDYNYNIDGSPWNIPPLWVTPRQITPDIAPELGTILWEMAHAPILSADVGHGGTQLKMMLVLEGGQKVAFKPKWYARDFVILGKPFSGADRHNGEIAAFHINRILGFNRTPLVVGRVVDLKREILPVATETLSKTFFFKDENRCFYGKCHYCKGKEDGVCANGDILEGAVVLWLPPNWKLQLHRHPWSRTYNEKTHARWEYDENFCEAVKTYPMYNEGPLLLDIVDTTVLDYLIGNADRHHFETFKDIYHGMLLMLDNAKSFGNPFHDERSILAPLIQCCVIRKSTYERLLPLRYGVMSTVLRKILSRDPLSPILSELHYQAIDRRLEEIIHTIHTCIKTHGKSELVLLSEKL